MVFLTIGSRDDQGTYRPVILTSAVGKLLDSILRKRINSHLEDDQLISVLAKICP